MRFSDYFLKEVGVQFNSLINNAGDRERVNWEQMG